MKKTLLLLLLIFMCVVSCSDLLEENPQALAVETFYNTPGEVEAGIAAIYNPIKNGISQQEAVSLITVMSDFFNGRASWENAGLYDVNYNTQNATRAQGRWINLYSAIRNANLIIQNVAENENLSDEDKSRYVGEAKFLRALSYLRLTQLWGAVPLRTEVNITEIAVPRSSTEDVYKLIVSDLEYAENELPDTPSPGHPSKWSAKTCLADAHFFFEDYSNAALKSNEVIKSGKFSLVEVSKPDDFENVFGAAVMNSSEEIFYFHYNEEHPWQYLRYLHGVNVPYLGLDGYFVAYSNKSFTQIINWDDNDLRKQYGWYEYDGFDPGTILCKKFNDPGSYYPSNNYPLYRYADVLLIFAEASCRANKKPTVDAVEALNQVHRRAYGYPSNQKSPVDFEISDYTEESFTELCFQERGYETIGEGKRWLDIKRLGKVKAREFIQKIRGVQITEGKFLYPIPQTEFDYNEAITEQNPGY